jgi:filamentous hemagglutinin family protein
MTSNHRAEVRKAVFQTRPLALAIALAFAGQRAYALDPRALPTGGVVQGGSAVATISQSGARMNINQSTQSAILNWNTFNIGSSAQVNFYQPSVSSVALNRINAGGGASEIFGQLNATGLVFLVNPSGVLFSPTAQVNVGGLVASTLNISDKDFRAGNYTFTTNSNGAGSVINQGTITTQGGTIALIAPEVRNDGTISAYGGSVVLGAGNQVRMDLNGNKLVSFEVDQGAAAAAIHNSGMISADGGQAVLTAKTADSLATSVVNNSGIVEAQTARNVNGVIRLGGDTVTNSGTLNANGGGQIEVKANHDVTLEATSTITANGAQGGKVTIQAQNGTLLADGRIEAKGSTVKGGDVKLLGNQVGLVNKASVDASGATGGGEVLVGGDYHGGNPNVQNASRTYVGSDVTVTADAIHNGDGGDVVIWANGDTRYYGNISAQGGVESGNGGRVEVSGKDTLLFRGAVDTLAPNGQAGSLLLDPTSIIINAGPAYTGSAASLRAWAPSNLGGTGDSIWANAEDPGAQTIGASDIVTLLNTGTLTLQATGNITVGNAINYGAAGATALTLNAGGTLNLNANINSTGGALATALTAGAGGVVFGGGSITSNGGNVAITSAGTEALGNITSGAGALNVTSAGAITQGGGTRLVIGGATSITAGAANNITLNNATNDFGQVQIVSGNNVNLRDANNFAFGNGGASAVSGNLRLVTAGPVTQPTGTLSVTGTTSITAGAANNITLNNAGNNFGGQVRIVSGNNVTLQDANPFAFGNGGNSVISGNLVLTTAGAITQPANALRVTGTTTITAGATNNITLNNAADVFGGQVQIVSGNNVTLRDANAFTFGVGTSTISGALSLTTAGAITQANPITVAGTATFAPGAANSVTLSNASNDFATVVLTNGTNATLRDANSIIFGASTITGILDITAAGNVTESGAVTAPTLTATLSGAASAINFGTAANNITNLGVSGGTGITAPGGFTLTNGNNNVNGQGVVTTTNSPISVSAGTGVFQMISNTAAFVTGSGSITTISDQFGIPSANASGVFQTTGNVILRPFSAGTAMSLANSVSTWNLITSEIAEAVGGITGAGSITFGAAGFSTGTMTIAGIVNLTNNLGSPINANIYAGAITDGGNMFLITARDLNLNTSAGGAGTSTIGAAGGSPINVAVTNLTVNTNNSDAFITSTAGFNLGDSSATIASNVGTGQLDLNVTTGGTITQTTAVTANTLTATLVGAGSALNLNTVNNNITNLGNAGTGITAPNGFALTNGNNPATVANTIDTSGNNGPVSINTGTGAYTQNNFDITAGSGNITITADAVNIVANTGNDAFHTTSALTIQPSTVSTNMSLAGASPFNLTAAEVTDLSGGVTGAGTITIGNTADTGVMNIGGSVNFGAKTVTLDAGSFTDLGGAFSVTATNLTLNASNGIGSSGNAVVTSTTGTLAAINTTSGNIFLAPIGNVNLGGATSVNEMVSAGTIDVNATGNIVLSGNVSVTGAGTINLNTAVTKTITRTGGTITTGGGAINLGNLGNTASIGASGAPIELAPGAGTVSATASTGGIFIDQSAGDLLTSKYTLSAAAVGTNIALSTTNGKITVDSTAGFNANTKDDNFSLTTAGATKNIDFTNATTLTAASATLSATGAITSGTAATDIDTSAANGAISLTGASIGAAGNAMELAPGTGAVSATASTGGIFIDQSAGNLQTSKYTLSAAAVGTNIALSTTNGSITVNSTAGFNANTQDDNWTLTTNGANQNIGFGSVAFSSASILANATGSVTIAAGGTISATAPGNSIVLAAGQNFINNAGPGVFNPGAGRWLVYSTDPALDTRGGLVYNFKQYNATYGVTAVLGAGNGFLYTIAPIITPSLTGTTTKVYDGTTTASLTAANYATTGSIDGDTVTLNNPSSGTYADKNVGVGKSVSATGVAIASATNGAATVYGYQLSSTSVSGNIGVITTAPLTVTPNAVSTVYNATTLNNTGYSDNTANYSITGFAGGETIASAGVTLANSMAFNGSTATAVKNAGSYTQGAGTLTLASTNNNYSLNFSNPTPNNYVITARPITVTANNQIKVYGNADPALTFTVGPMGLAGGDTNASVFSGALTRALGENVIGSPYVISQGSLVANTDYMVTGFSNGALIITPAPLIVTADDKLRLVNTPNPALTASFSGFKFSDTPSMLGGALVFATPATTTSPAGAYPISASGLTSTNYTISYVNGTLTVFTAQPPTGAIIAVVQQLGSSPVSTTSVAEAGDFFNTLPPTGAGNDGSNVVVFSPYISIVDCGLRMPFSTKKDCAP